MVACSITIMMRNQQARVVQVELSIHDAHLPWRSTHAWVILLLHRCGTVRTYILLRTNCSHVCFTATDRMTGRHASCGGLKLEVAKTTATTVVGFYIKSLVAATCKYQVKQQPWRSDSPHVRRGRLWLRTKHPHSPTVL